MLYFDIPTLAQFKALAQVRADACVSLYVPTPPLSHESPASEIELRKLFSAASAPTVTMSWWTRAPRKTCRTF
jgi:hypothetical protein